MQPRWNNSIHYTKPDTETSVVICTWILVSDKRLFRHILQQNHSGKRWTTLVRYTYVGWLCWGLTSQSTIFQSCRDGAIASWVINQYFRGVKCLAQGHNTAAVGLEPRTSRSGVRHSTTEPPRSPYTYVTATIIFDKMHRKTGSDLPVNCRSLISIRLVLCR